MSYQMEDLGKNLVKFTIEVDAEEVKKALVSAYEKVKGQISAPGFRKGKVPYNMVVKMYGEEVLHDDAADIMMPPAYKEAIDNAAIEVASQPEVDIKQFEKGKNFIFEATVAVKPEVKLGTYKGVEIAKVDVEVTDEEIEAEINKERDSNSRLVVVEDRAAEMGDITTIDFEGFIDGVAFDGGKGEDHPLELGSGAFIPGFEEQLVGKNTGDEVDVKVTFPEEYHAPDLKGKEAVFKVKVKEIKHKELPELNDEFASEVSEFDTLEEYKDDIKAKLLETKEKEAKNKKTEEAVEKAVENAEMEIPELMINSHVKQMANDFAYRVQSQGISVDQYLQMMGMTRDQLLDQMKPSAEKRLKNSLVLEAVANAENIVPTDEDVDAEIERMAEMYKMDAEKLKSQIVGEEREQMKEDLRMQKASELIFENAVEK